MPSGFPDHWSLLFLFFKGILRRTKLIINFSSSSFYKFLCIEFKLFLRLPAICLLKSVVLLIRHSAFSCQKFEGEKSQAIYFKVFKFVLFQGYKYNLLTCPLLATGQKLKTSTISHSVTKNALNFPIMTNYMRHFACNVHFIIKPYPYYYVCIR